MTTSTDKKPLVYSCSGCSSSAQMANYLAVKMDRAGMADMSCIAGIGGRVDQLVHTALSGRKIIALDGCSLACTKVCLLQHALNPDAHFDLVSLGVTKQEHEDFDLKEADHIYAEIESLLHDLRIGKFLASPDVLEKPDNKKGIPDSSSTFTTLLDDTITIREVLNQDQLNDFINFPYRLYQDNKY